MMPHLLVRVPNKHNNLMSIISISHYGFTKSFNYQEGDDIAYYCKHYILINMHETGMKPMFRLGLIKNLNNLLISLRNTFRVKA